MQVSPLMEAVLVIQTYAISALLAVLLGPLSLIDTLTLGSWGRLNSIYHAARGGLRHMRPPLKASIFGVSAWQVMSRMLFPAHPTEGVTLYLAFLLGSKLRRSQNLAKA